MMRIVTLMTSFTKKLFKKKNKDILQVEVPMTCKTVSDKHEVIFATLNFLERKIKIEDYE